GIPRGTWRARLDRGPQYPDRHPLDGNRRRRIDATICGGTRRAATRPHYHAKYTDYRGGTARGPAPSPLSAAQQVRQLSKGIADVAIRRSPRGKKTRTGRSCPIATSYAIGQPSPGFPVRT